MTRYDLTPGGLVKRDTEVQGDVKDRLFLTVIFVGQLSMLEGDGLAFGEKGDLY